MTSSNKQWLSVLIVAGVIILVVLFISVRCGATDASLKYRGELREVLYDLLHASDTHADWTTAKVDNAINLGITLVEGISKANEIHDTITFNTSFTDTGSFYPLSSDAATGGVLNVIYYNSTTDQLIALSRRNVEDFGKDQIGEDEAPALFPYMYAIFNDTLMVYPLPDNEYVMHVFSYKMSDWLSKTSADTVVNLPIFERLMVIEAAYGYAQLMTGTTEGFQKYMQMRQNVLEALLGLPPEPAEKVQPLGIEAAP